MDGCEVPGATIGVVGGGQLGRMLAEAAAPLGVQLDILDPTPGCPAAPLAREHIVAPFDHRPAIERLAAGVDVLTYEIELADPAVLEAVSAATDTPVHPTPDTLRITQDKLEENRQFSAAGIGVPSFEAVESSAEVKAACESLGYPAMLKARTGGYDGRGNVRIASPDDVAPALAELEGPALVERLVPFEREISVIGVQGADRHDSYVAVENVHEAEILRETVVPARTDATIRERAREVANDVLSVLDGRGVFGIELFETPAGEILVNEIAPRPHNSGHWTIEGAVTSQFEQHVRAVLGRPIGDTTHRRGTITANILGDVEDPRPAHLEGVDSVLEAGDVKLHWYEKSEVRPLRKMGHLTLPEVPIDDRDAALAKARGLIDSLSFGPAPE